MADPRSHPRYSRTRRAWLPTADPVCCHCRRPVDTSLPGTHPLGPTVEHTLPVRVILASVGSWADAVDLACDTSLWLLAHKRCNDAQGAHVTNAKARQQVRPGSRRW